MYGWFLLEQWAHTVNTGP